MAELARRAALLAALFPFPDGSGGATALATTVLGDTGDGRRASGRRPRAGRRRAALVAATVLVVLLGAGAGISYAGTRPAGAGRRPPARRVAGPAGARRASSLSDAPSDARRRPLPPRRRRRPGTTAAPPTTVAPPTTAAPARTSAAPTPPAVRGAAVLPRRRTARPPTVSGWRPARVRLDPDGCPYGATSATVTATVTDDRTPGRGACGSASTTRSRAAAVTSRWPRPGRGCSGAPSGRCRPPRTTTRIPIVVTAMDAAGNAASAPTVYVTLDSYCTPG